MKLKTFDNIESLKENEIIVFGSNGLGHHLGGLAMMTAQIWGAIILFGGHSKAPKWFKITLGVLLLLNFLAIIGLSQ